MKDQLDALQELGEVALEEILVRAGIDQAHDALGDEIPVALNFRVGVDPEQNQLVIRGERLGQAPLELRLALPEAPSEWRTLKKDPAPSLGR